MAGGPVSDRPGHTRRGLRWVFAGQGPMGAAALESLVARVRPAAVLAAEPLWGERPVAAIAEAHGLDLHHTDRLGQAPAQEWPDLFGGLDLGVACCWGEVLAAEALRAPAGGWLNLHPSALPAWRGADPVAWQLLAAPSAIGCSVHRMTGGIDDGPVLTEGSVPVSEGDDRGVVLARSGARLGVLAADLLERIEAGAYVPERPQREEEATWCPPASVVPLIDPRAMRARGGARIARAFSPRPGVAVATLPPGQRLGLAGDRPALGRALDVGEAPGAVDQAEGRPHEVAVAFTDRWLHGHLLLPAPA